MSQSQPRKTSKGILKQPTQTFGTKDNGSERHDRLRWDEANIEYNEGQPKATMKIEEPKTPYVHYNADTDEVMDLDNIPGLNLGEAENANPAPINTDVAIEQGSLPPSPRSPKRVVVDEVMQDDLGRHDPEEMDEEALEKHHKFQEMRAKHYQMRDALRLGKKLDDDSDDSDDSEIGNEEAISQAVNADEQAQLQPPGQFSQGSQSRSKLSGPAKRGKASSASQPPPVPSLPQSSKP